MRTRENLNYLYLFTSEVSVWNGFYKASPKTTWLNIVCQLAVTETVTSNIVVPGSQRSSERSHGVPESANWKGRVRPSGCVGTRHPFRWGKRRTHQIPFVVNNNRADIKITVAIPRDRRPPITPPLFQINKTRMNEKQKFHVWTTVGDGLWNVAASRHDYGGSLLCFGVEDDLTLEQGGQGRESPLFWKHEALNCFWGEGN
ncbi:hypothetical protein TNCV_3388711 [Trichonephila clavipes]|nr:hypothetical protein TNCV_3388711 [Trichonephila clavipes]